jgi:PAS domain S-box-containing protein
MNKTKTACPKARRLNRGHDGLNGERRNRARGKAFDPKHRADLGSTTSDLAERKRVVAPQHSESRYRVLFDLGPVAIYSIDTSGVIQEFNRRAAELWGREPALGDTDERFCGSFKLYRPDGSFMPHEQCPMAEVVSGKILEARDAEVLIERPNGSRVTVVVNIRPLRNARGEIAGAINCFYDITARKRAEVLLDSQRQALQLLAEGAPLEDVLRFLVGVVERDSAKDMLAAITPLNEAGTCFQRGVGARLPEAFNAAVEGVAISSPIGLCASAIRRREAVAVHDFNAEPAWQPFGKFIAPYGLRSGWSTSIVSSTGRILGAFANYFRHAGDPTPQNQELVDMVVRTAAIAIERKHAELRLAEQARLLDLSNDAILVRDAHERIVYWNRGATELYGYRAEEALGKATHQLLRTEHPQPLAHIRKKLERDGRWSGELVQTRKDGTKIVVMSRWSLDRDAHGKPSSVLETNIDITERKRAEATLQKSKGLLESRVRERTRELRLANRELENEIKRRKGLEGEILEIADREQQRLGQELHDGICQHLTAVAFMARSVAVRLKNHRVIEVSDIEKIAELVNAAAADTRNLSRALHRVDIDAARLEDVLQDLVDREIWRTPCRLEIKAPVHLNDDMAALNLYRIAREAVVNANKHAQAREIVVALERRRKGIVLSVSDNGVGLRNRLNNTQGLGFHIMNYRARSIGGRLEIESPKQGGTRVACHLPDNAPQSQKRESARLECVPAKTAKASAAGNLNFLHRTARRAANR